MNVSVFWIPYLILQKCSPKMRIDMIKINCNNYGSKSRLWWRKKGGGWKKCYIQELLIRKKSRVNSCNCRDENDLDFGTSKSLTGFWRFLTECIIWKEEKSHPTCIIAILIFLFLLYIPLANRFIISTGDARGDWLVHITQLESHWL